MVLTLSLIIVVCCCIIAVLLTGDHVQIGGVSHNTFNSTFNEPDEHRVDWEDG